MHSRGTAISFYGSDRKRRGIHRAPKASSTFHVCLLCVLLISSQIYNVEGALGRNRKAYNIFPFVYRDRIESGEHGGLQKREIPTSGWELADDLGTLEAGENFDDINDAVLSSEKTSLTREEIQKYLAQMKAYYLKNGMPRNLFAVALCSESLSVNGQRLIRYKRPDEIKYF